MKKATSTFDVNTLHFIIAGVMIPTLAHLAAGSVLPSVDMDAVLLQLVSNSIWLLSVGFGVMYSVSYLTKTYWIANASTTVNLSTQKFIVAAPILNILFSDANVLNDQVAMTIFGCFTVAGIVVFYLLSKKYIVQDDHSGRE